MKKNSIKVSMYNKIGTLGLAVLTVVFAVLALMMPNLGPLVIIVLCLIIIIFKLDVLTLEIMKLYEQNKK